jgi:hypothetical protein
MEWWNGAATWAQAVLSALAIVFAVRVATGQERRSIARRTGVLVEVIKNASSQAAMLKTFFGGHEGEDDRETLYGVQAKVFEDNASALRAIPLENVADARLLIPIHNAAQSCEIVAKLLRAQTPKSPSEELNKWFADLKEATYMMFDAHTAAFKIHAEYDSQRFTPLLRGLYYRAKMIRFKRSH